MLPRLFNNALLGIAGVGQLRPGGGQPPTPAHKPWNPRTSGFATMNPHEQKARIAELWKTRPEMRDQWRANAGSEQFAEKRKSWGPQFMQMWQNQAAQTRGPGSPRQPQPRPGVPYQPHLPPQRGLPPGYADRFAP